MQTFRIALTGDFLNAQGTSAYGDLNLATWDRAPHIQHHFLTHQAPTADSRNSDRLYSLEVAARDLEQVNGLVVLRPWVKSSAIAAVADTLVVIGRSGAGYDKIDIVACTDHDVALFNVPRALDHPTASSALLFMLALSKQLPAQQYAVRAGRWDLQAEMMGSEIRGRTLGIVGLGNSGRELARLVAPFEMRLLAYSPHADPRRAATLGVRLASLDELLAAVDFVSLHCRLTADNHRMIGHRELALMKSSAFFINVARGELVDQAALVDAIRRRRIAGAALDVYDHEPLPQGDPLLELDNVILTPHWSASTKDAFAATGRAMAEGMSRASRGEVPNNVVNPEVLVRPRFLAKLAQFACNAPPSREADRSTGSSASN